MKFDLSKEETELEEMYPCILFSHNSGIVQFSYMDDGKDLIECTTYPFEISRLKKG